MLRSALGVEAVGHQRVGRELRSIARHQVKLDSTKLQNCFHLPNRCFFVKKTRLPHQTWLFYRFFHVFPTQSRFLLMAQAPKRSSCCQAEKPLSWRIQFTPAEQVQVPKPSRLRFGNEKPHNSHIYSTLNKKPGQKRQEEEEEAEDEEEEEDEEE